MNVGDIKLETITSAKTGVTTTVEHIVTQEEVDCYNEQCAIEEARSHELTEAESSRLQMLDMFEILIDEIDIIKEVN